jgi:16S rRNA processing protein RimM
VDDAAQRPHQVPRRGSGGQAREPEPRYLTIGQVVGAHGLRGEIKVRILTDDPQRFGRLRRVYIGLPDKEPKPWVLQSHRLHRGQILLKLKGCSDRAGAATFLYHLVQVPLSEAIPLEEGEYFEHQILGLGVWTADEEFLGQVVDILYTGANEVYVVHDEARRKEILIPAIEGVVLAVDLEAERLVVELPPGLV